VAAMSPFKGKMGTYEVIPVCAAMFYKEK